MTRQRLDWHAFALALAVGCDDGVTANDAAIPTRSDTGTVEPSDTGVAVAFTAEAADDLPCRITVEGLDATASPEWSADAAGQVGRWVSDQAVAVDNTIVALRCVLDVPLDPGEYRVTVSHGIEWEAWAGNVSVTAGARTPATGTLERAVDSTGWICLDAHVHSAPSFDSDVPLDQRLISAVAEGLDALVPTDHNAVADWGPALEVTALADVLVVIPGDEITPDQWPSGGPLGHFNVYPTPPDYLPNQVEVPGEGALALVTAARVAAPDAILQINHPRWDGNIGYFSQIGFDPATLAGLDIDVVNDVQTLEVWNGHELDRPDGSALEENLVDWFALLNAGYPLVGVANTDTHRLARSAVGMPRTCVALSSSTVTAAAFVDALRAGRAFGTSGPWLELTVDASFPGATVTGGPHQVRVEVQAASWVDVDRVNLIINGVLTDSQVVDALPAAVAFDVDLAASGWLLATAEGDDPLGTPAGTHASLMRSFAFTNPVFVYVAN